jgi:hypothetical protein
MNPLGRVAVGYVIRVLQVKRLRLQFNRQLLVVRIYFSGD